MSKIKPSIPKGTRDFGPEVMVRREYIFNTLRKIFRKYGYMPLETPSMEKMEVLTGKYGEEGDRLIFKILDNGDYLKELPPGSVGNVQQGNATLGEFTRNISSKALRYDLTVPFARFVVMNQSDITFPFKRYQIQPVWRADRPQKGRYREFFQCDADVVGSDSLIYDAELIALYEEAFKALDLKVNILINNRKVLTGFAEYIGAKERVAEMCIALDKLDKIGEEKVKNELVGRDFSQDQADTLFNLLNDIQGGNSEKLTALKTAFSEKSCENGLAGVAELEEVFQLYENYGNQSAEVVFDLTLARGLDYYTGTIFEVKSDEMKFGSIGGGGRYADLTGVFGKDGLSGIGISFGADRIYDVMLQLGKFDDLIIAPVRILFLNFGEESVNKSMAVVRKLRNEGIAADIYPDKTKLGKQFGFADKKAVPYVGMIGSEELESGQINLKNMTSGDQELVSFEELLNQLK